MLQILIIEVPKFFYRNLDSELQNLFKNFQAVLKIKIKCRVNFLKIFPGSGMDNSTLNDLDQQIQIYLKENFYNLEKRT